MHGQEERRHHHHGSGVPQAADGQPAGGQHGSLLACREVPGILPLRTEEEGRSCSRPRLPGSPPSPRCGAEAFTLPPLRLMAGLVGRPVIPGRFLADHGVVLFLDRAPNSQQHPPRRSQAAMEGSAAEIRAGQVTYTRSLQVPAHHCMNLPLPKVFAEGWDPGRQ